jgi:hypothetical protein
MSGGAMGGQRCMRRAGRTLATSPGRSRRAEPGTPERTWRTARRARSSSRGGGRTRAPSDA